MHNDLMSGQAVIRSFFVLVADSAPLFAVGVLLSAAAQRWIKPSWAERWLANSSGSVLAATFAGALLPGCAVTTMPLASVFRDRGARVGTLTAFIMIAPILSPHTVILNAVMLGPEMTIGRIVLPLVLSIALGLALNAIHVKRPVESATDLHAGHGNADCDTCCDNQRRGYWQTVWRLLRDLLPYFAVGLLAVAFLQEFIPHSTMTKYMRHGWMAYLVAMVAGIPLYVCEGAEVPLTLALLKLGVGAGPAFTFLLSSVGTCLPTIAMAPKVIGWNATIMYLACWFLLAVGGGAIMGLMF